jgi:hypothetical protein
MEMKCTSRPARSPKSLCTRANVAPSGGQTVVQVVKMKLMATTLPLTRSL